MSDRAIVHIEASESMLERLLGLICPRWDRKLDEILHILHRMETKMATIADLNTAADAVQGVLTANDARVAALATAVSDAAASAAAHDAELLAQIQALQDQINAGGDPAALQAVVDKLAAMATEGQAEGDAIDAATTALAAAFPPPAPPTP